MLDTYKVIKRLEGSGFTAEQAETITDVMVESQQEGFAALATKTDLRELAQSTKTEIRELAQSTKAEIHELELRMQKEFAAVRGEIAGVRGEIKGVKAEMLQWFIGSLAAFSGVIIASFKLIGH